MTERDSTSDAGGDGEVDASVGGDFDRVIGPSAPEHIGAFRLWFDPPRWQWSAELARMHGYSPETVTPTTELVIKHLHPDDRERVMATISRAIETQRPFVSRHRMVDDDGGVHYVLVVSDYARGEQRGTVQQPAGDLSGHFIDLTATLDEHRQLTLDDTLPGLYAARAEIEQAKGALMVVYGVSSEQAFRVLSWRSQESNVKLRTLASQLLADFSAIKQSSPELRARFDQLLLNPAADSTEQS